MKLYFVLCLTLMLPASVVGQSTTLSPAVYCGSVGNFTECKAPGFECNDNSKCFCKDEKPYCRCNNYKDWWFMGDNCEQQWSILTFALVATLPGVALAAIVGVIVQCIHQRRKPAKTKAPKNPNGPTRQNKIPQGTYDEDQDGAYSNMVFASDMTGPPRGPSMQPTQERFPMTSQPRQPYRPQPNGMKPSFDTNMANPGSQQPYRPQPNNMLPSSGRTPVANPGSQPYNYAAGMMPPVGNPYGTPRSPSVRNPYEDRAPPSDRSEDYRPSQYQNSMMGGGMSGYPASSSPTPFSRTQEYGPSRSQFPRAQMGRNM